MRKAKGFTLIELIAVIVILGVLSVSMLVRTSSTSVLELQGSRDEFITAFFSAQQYAMSQDRAVSLSTSGSTIQVLEDLNDDGVPETNATILAKTYPITIRASLSSHVFNFNRLGETNAQAVTVSEGSASVIVTVTETGYAY